MSDFLYGYSFADTFRDGRTREELDRARARVGKRAEGADWQRLARIGVEYQTPLRP